MTLARPTAEDTTERVADYDAETAARILSDDTVLDSLSEEQLEDYIRDALPLVHELDRSVLFAPVRVGRVCEILQSIHGTLKVEFADLCAETSRRREVSIRVGGRNAVRAAQLDAEFREEAADLQADRAAVEFLLLRGKRATTQANKAATRMMIEQAEARKQARDRASVARAHAERSQMRAALITVAQAVAAHRGTLAHPSPVDALLHQVLDEVTIPHGTADVITLTELVAALDKEHGRSVTGLVEP